MPYKINQDGNQWQVVETEGGKVVGIHPTKAKAEAQLRALYANVTDAKAAGEYVITQTPEMKYGRRNSTDDVARLRKIREMLDELLSDEAEPEAEPEKSMNLSYVKSLGLSLPDDIGAVKAIGADEIRGYVTLWGSDKLTDVELEYFTPKTDFWDKTLGKAARPLTWDHAQDEATKADPVIGQMVDFGDDEVGRWYVAKLDRSHKYRAAIDALIKKGVLGTSSDSAPQYVIREKTGKATWLKQWPLFAAALTDTPAEPRMIGSLEYLKSIGVILPPENPVQDWRWLAARINLLNLKK